MTRNDRPCCVPLAEIGSSATGKLFVRYAEKIDDPRLLQLFETADGRNVADNRILAVALDLHESGKPVVFVSKDINLRLKADALNLRVEDFNREKVQMDVLYTGFQNFEVENSVISKLHKEKEIEFKAELCPNEFAVLNGKDKSALARNAGNRKIRLVESPPEWRVWNITSKVSGTVSRAVPTSRFRYMIAIQRTHRAQKYFNERMKYFMTSDVCLLFFRYLLWGLVCGGLQILLVLNQRIANPL